MKKIIIVLVCLVFLGGCAADTTKSLAELRNDNRFNLTKLSVGMSKEQVFEIMGEETGEVNVGTLLHPGIMSATNPYKKEILQGKNRIYEMYYYYTDIGKGSYFSIAEDELTPLVFDKGKLMGWGWRFIETNIQKYELRIK